MKRIPGPGLDTYDSYHNNKAVEDPRNIDWFDTSRLLVGSKSQRSAARLLKRLEIFELLADYTPILCGTVPLGCDLPGSDLDIVCRAERLPAFKEILHLFFGDRPCFECTGMRLAGIESVVARFRAGRWRLEIVGQPVPVLRQRAFEHMLAEALLLHRAGLGANEEVRRLKQQGFSTEEAFGKLFGLRGDPYEALSKIYGREIIENL